MILSVSRRTDIPAFYSEWFFNRLKQGYVLVRNPMNHLQVSRISLKKEDVECIVFWTKNPQVMLTRLDELEGYDYYFQVTITAYDEDVELGVPSKLAVIKHFQTLSKMIGKEKMIWRYDPIMITAKYTETYHLECFELMAKELSGYTDKCVISFIDLYKKLKNLHTESLTADAVKRLARGLHNIAEKYELTIETCAENMDLSEEEINHGKCIDDVLISKLLGRGGTVPKDMNQREGCGCVKSVDIGIYNTCPHQCAYCYANTSASSAYSNYQQHDPTSELLFGKITTDDVITDRKTKNYFTDFQLNLFNQMNT